MATILAAATGNWSATGTWTGGVVPVAGDIVVANNKIITMDTLNVTVAELRNDTTGGATVNGYFNCVNGNNISANIYAGSGGNSCVAWTGTAGQSITLTGNFFGGSNGTVSASAIYCGGGNLVIGGGSSATGGTGSGQSCGIYFTSSGTLTFATAGIPGAITGGASTNSAARGLFCDQINSTINIFASSISGSATGSGHGVSFSGANQTVNITATNIGATSQNAVAVNASGASANHTYTISGTVSGGLSATQFNSTGITVSSTGTYNLTVSGNITAGSGNGAHGIYLNSAATINIAGNATNNASVNTNNSSSVFNNSTGSVNFTGIATAGAIGHGIYNASTGVVRVTRAKGNGYGNGSVGVSGGLYALVSAAQGSLSYVEEIEFGSLGSTPVIGPIRLTATTTNRAIFTTTTGTAKTLSDPAATSGLVPAATDVRTGVVYSSGNLTGTCAVPAAGSVALGVAVDNTTGTAALTVANVQTALTSQGLTSTRAGYLDNIATAPPSAASIASAVWAAATRTLTTAIDNSSTIAAAVWSYATGRTITGGTVDTLTNAPSVPSAAAIATQVRTELSTELGRIDVATSTRLAPSGTLARVTLADTTTTLTNAPSVPSAATIASQVRTELTPELARMANAATVDTTGQQIQDAVTN